MRERRKKDEDHKWGGQGKGYRHDIELVNSRRVVHGTGMYLLGKDRWEKTQRLDPCWLAKARWGISYPLFIFQP